MHHFQFNSPHFSIGIYLSYIIFLFYIPAYGAEPIDGFRDLKFGMTPLEVQALKNCSTSHECLYELSDKVRYLQLTYDNNTTTPGSDSSEPPRLIKVSIDMGQYSDSWHQQLQMILGSSYRLTHDFTDETMKAFLENKLEELQAGYEDGHIVLTLARRQFGNMTLKVAYQNATLAKMFIQQAQAPLITEP